MRNDKRVETRILASVCMLTLLLLFTAPGVAAAQSDSAAASDWEFAITPFLWGSGMDGTVGIAGHEADFEASLQQLLEALDFGFMANVEGRRNRWVFAFDFVYTALEKDATIGSAVGASTTVPGQLDMSMTIAGGDVGYQVAKNVDVLAGVRGVFTPVSLTADSVNLGEVDGGFVDPIIGARFQHNLTEKVWAKLRGDIGGFGVGSDFSWHIRVALGYRVSHLISLGAGYAGWSFDYSGDGDLKWLDATLAGFAFGAMFHL